MRLSLLLFFSCCSVVVVFSAHSRVSNIIYNAISILSVAVMKLRYQLNPEIGKSFTSHWVPPQLFCCFQSLFSPGATEERN